MIRRILSTWKMLVVGLLALAGCHPTQPFYFFDDGDLSHYVDKATQIEYPDSDTETLADVKNSEPPLTLENATPREFWDICLEDCVKIALDNTKVMRSLGGRYSSSAFQPRAQVGEAPDSLLVAPDASRSVYDPAITETTPFTGTEYALSAFDAQLSTSTTWQHNDRAQNIRPALGSIFPLDFVENNATFQAALSKTNATGGTWTMSNNTFYDQTNNPSWAVPSTYAVTYQTAFNQPLMQGAGVLYNRIAGPFNPFQVTPNNLATNTFQFDGVMLARINVDISLADFETGVRNLVHDVEDAYWELYFSYRALEASKSGRDSAQQTWQKIHALYIVSARGGEAEKEAQARAQYFLFKGQVETSLNDLLGAENRLRYVIGLGVADGRLMRPKDEPTTAEVRFDWSDVNAEANARSVELRRQKWRIKERELEIIAAKNLLLPRLDVNGNYQWFGLGDQLISSNRATLPIDPTNPLFGTNAYQNLTSGKYQSWQLGFNFQMALGFRAALSTVRHYQLQLAKEKARLQDQELEVSHDVAHAIRLMTYNYTLSQTNLNRRIATGKQVEAVLAAFQAETVTLDLLLDAQRQRAEAEVAYFRALTDYQRGIAQVHWRKGSILEYDGVYLAEGPWPAKAQWDAQRLARQRDASHYLDYGFTRPGVISRGLYLQNSKDGPDGGENDYRIMHQEGGMTLEPEAVPTPTPTKSRTGSGTAGGQPKMLTGGDAPTGKPAPGGKENGFDWSGLGLASSEASRPVSAPNGDNQGRAKAASQKVASGKATQASSPRSQATTDSGVRQASYQEWKPSGSNESDQNPSARTADRPASGWQGTQR